MCATECKETEIETALRLVSRLQRKEYAGEQARNELERFVRRTLGPDNWIADLGERLLAAGLSPVLEHPIQAQVRSFDQVEEVQLVMYLGEHYSCPAWAGLVLSTGLPQIFSVEDLGIEI